MQVALKAPKKRDNAGVKSISSLSQRRDAPVYIGGESPLARQTRARAQLAVRAVTDIQDLLWWSAAAEPIPADVRDVHSRPTQKP